jgi:hypothetical protein
MIKSVILLISIIGVYYFLFKKYPDKYTTKTHIYFTLFCTVYMVVFYLLNHQKMFVYKVVKNMKEAEEKPLYDINHSFYKENQMVGLKNNLAMRQGWRCISCKNPVLQKDVYSCKVNYIKPLEFGGVNHVNNLAIYCPSCSTFTQF